MEIQLAFCLLLSGAGSSEGKAPASLPEVCPGETLLLRGADLAGSGSAVRSRAALCAQPLASPLQGLPPGTPPCPAPVMQLYLLLHCGPLESSRSPRGLGP